jgi:hypothetical protein
MELSRELLEAYRATSYHVITDEGEQILRIGVVNGWAQRALAGCGRDGAVFVTAWNPFSVSVGEDANTRANARLEAELRASVTHVWSGPGVSADGNWLEPSYFAYPVTRAAALTLCRGYDQAAVVFVGADGVPELVFHPDVRFV